jgi:hypothetical protein
MNGKCGACKKNLNIVEATINCKCGLSFCTKHRDFQKHACTFNYKDHEREKLRAQLAQSANCVEIGDLSFHQYFERYEIQHNSRMVRSIHSISFVSSIVYFCLAVIFWLLNIRQSLLFWLARTAVVSLMILGMGKLLSWFLSDNNCKMCLCSLEATSNIRFAWDCEVRAMLTHAMYTH